LSVPHKRVSTLIGTEIVPRAPSRALPITRKLVSVAVRAALRYALANALGEISRCEAPSMSPYMLA
jgi:hypothetical protein